jgi:hypothetical protein
LARTFSVCSWGGDAFSKVSMIISSPVNFLINETTQILKLINKLHHYYKQQNSRETNNALNHLECKKSNEKFALWDLIKKKHSDTNDFLIFG